MEEFCGHEGGGPKGLRISGLWFALSLIICPSLLDAPNRLLSRQGILIVMVIYSKKWRQNNMHFFNRCQNKAYITISSERCKSYRGKNRSANKIIIYSERRILKIASIKELKVVTNSENAIPRNTNEIKEYYKGSNWNRIISQTLSILVWILPPFSS